MVSLPLLAMLLSGCGGLTNYSANPEKIPGAGKKISSGVLLVSGVRQDKEDLDDYLSSGGKQSDYYDIYSYYGNPEKKHYLDLKPSFDIIPYVVPMMKPVVKELVGADFYITLKGELSGGVVRYAVPKFRSDYPLKKIRLNISKLQPQIYLEEQRSDSGGVFKPFGLATLRYPNLLVENRETCTAPASIELSPYQVDFYEQDRAFSDEYKARLRSEYLSSDKYKLHVDASGLALCLVARMDE